MTILDPCMSLERIKKVLVCVGSCGYAPASVKRNIMSFFYQYQNPTLCKTMRREIGKVQVN